VGIRVHATVGTRVEKNDKLFTVHAKGGHQVQAGPYLQTIRMAPNPSTASHWLLETVGC
jgi:thymidine phosphorylase